LWCVFSAGNGDVDFFVAGELVFQAVAVWGHFRSNSARFVDLRSFVFSGPVFGESTTEVLS